MLDYKDLNDTALAEKFRLGDDAAFREIYIRYDKLLFIFALRKLEDRDEAMDVVQDIFMWVLRNREKFAVNTSLSSYLYKSVLHKILDIFRHQKTIRRYIDQGEHYIEVDSQETDYLIREKQVMEMIDREIAAMPPRMREVYMLKHMQHLNSAQIAEQLGISEHTVLVHLQRGSKQMRDKLGLLIPVLYFLSLLLIVLVCQSSFYILF